MTHGEPCQALVFVYPDLTHGPILEATGIFLIEARENSRDIGDHNISTPNLPGLQIFEGWIEVSTGEDPDVRWEGGWRLLTHWEMCRVRHGVSPFGEKT